ncbi:hypothetical protein BDV98DRAFT_568982 [Pterulicium gracile]|uniref:Aminoglycoside phosphotransferase domain-containing protein n=1 Tax=Pterulicium gracile TaxID=1884261 RepID=A0A5C3QL68_9AGAR|nr:hypothetical protein BDV98DRAFT_568982 [Pterula gracilis]
MISARLPDLLLDVHVFASEEQVKAITATLKDWLLQLRALESPYGERVCSFLGSSYKNPRIRALSRPSLRPSSTLAEFHSQGCCTVSPAILESSERARTLVEMRADSKYRTHLIHGDIHAGNILADKDFRLTGLVDWEAAAWMPEYWELVTARRDGQDEESVWKDVMLDAFPSEYRRELEIDDYADQSGHNTFW